MVHEVYIKKQPLKGLAFGKSGMPVRFLPRFLNEPTKPPVAKSVEQGPCGGAETGVYAGRIGADRGAFVGSRKLARLGVAEFWAGYDVSGQRPFGYTGLAGAVSQRTDTNPDYTQATKNRTWGVSCPDQSDQNLFDDVAGAKRQGPAGLRVHAFKAQRCSTDKPFTLRGYRQNMGVLAWLRQPRIFQSFNSALQTQPHVLGGRRHRADLAFAWAQKHRQYHRVFGHYPSQSRTSGPAPCADAGTKQKSRQLSKDLTGLLRSGSRKPLSRLALRLVKLHRCQTFFCQLNLTQNLFWVQNKDNYFFQKMGKFGKLAGALSVMGALAAPAAAQETTSAVVLASSEGVSTQVTDCVGFVREQRDLARETGITMSRSAQKGLLLDCQNGELEARIAEQQQILASLDTAIHQINLRIDENARILDENDQVIAHIIAINGQLVIRRQEVQAETEASQRRQEQMLDEAERILNELVG